MKKALTKRRSVKATASEETIAPEISYDTVNETAERPKKSGRSNFLVYTVLAIALLVAGNLYSRVKVLEKGAAAPTQAGQPAAAGKTPEIADSDPVLGAKNAKVTMIIYEDFQCPFCGAFTGSNEEMVANMKSRDPSWEPTIVNVIKDYVNTNKVKIVWKDYPFLGQESYDSAEAGRCAQEQGKFWEFHDYLFSHQSGENQGAFSKDNLKKFAADLGLNTTAFNTCLDGGKYTKQMQEAQAAGQAVGVSGTPGVFVNGEFTSGAASYAQFKAQIEKALQS